MGFKAAMMAQGSPIPTTWNIVKVGEVADVNRSTISLNNAPKWIEYIDISSIGERTMDTPIFMEFNSAPSRARRQVFSRDILISTVRPNLKHFIYLKQTKENWIASTGFAVISAKSKVSSRYLYYYLTSEVFTEYLTRVADGGAYPAFNPSEIKDAELLLPPPSEQKAIAHILATLDDKIELNQKMNRKLEAIAQAIFKSWFVTFDPVRAKMEGHQPVGMDAATAALFPDLIEESPLGEIPRDWRIGVFEDLVEILSGGTPKTSIPEYWNGDVLWFSVKDAPNKSDIFVVNTEKRITKLGVDKSATQILPIGTTIITARGTVGKLALVGVEMAMNQSCFGVKGKNGYTDFFTYYHLYTLISDFQHKTHGSVFDTINRQTFKSVRAILPSIKISQAFDYKVNPIMQKIKNNLFEFHTLTAIRDTLLPKLMSGEIRVKEAEKILEDAA